MKDVMQLKRACDPVRAEITDSIEAILTRMLDEQYDGFSIFELLEKPPEATMGDYAMPCFRLAKLLKQKPQDIAETIKLELEKDRCEWIDSVKVVGAFLNIITSKKALASEVITKVMNGSFFEVFSKSAINASINVMIEYSQPNTHKEFHVGHGRNVCLGDSLCRLFRYNGYNVLAVNYIGDEGAHIAKCLWQLDQQSESKPSDMTKTEWYGKNYVEANKKLENSSEDEKKTYLQEISSVLRAIENKEGKYYEIWQKSREECLADFRSTYEWLDVHFDHYFFESEFSNESQRLVDEYLDKGFFEVSEGAVGKDLSSEKLGFCMVRKSDGNIPYMTRDIALARKKFDEFNIDRSIYVVGSEQIFHFNQLFKVLQMMGFKQADECFHLSYGMVVRPDGKMSSRLGNSVTFGTLKQQILQELSEYLERYKDQWNPQEVEEIAHRLSVGAIKYGMLQSDPNREITFELSQWLSFEGNTGPYLMYTYARIKSILRKAEDEGIVSADKEFDLLNHDLELEILRYLYDFNNVCMQACETYRPSVLAQYLFNLCKSFNRYYSEVSVLKADTLDLKRERVTLLHAFSLTLYQGLALLGITPPEKM
ncbi:MAG: arginine--tRNA ligase [Bdellovibrionota bacterium]